jgi:hypothetical protein
MRHFFRTHLTPDEVLGEADAFFPTLALTVGSSAARERTYSGTLGTVTIRARPEGGHYTFVQADTDQMGESRMDRNVKSYFVRLHRLADPQHKLTASY